MIVSSTKPIHTNQTILEQKKREITEQNTFNEHLTHLYSSSSSILYLEMLSNEALSLPLCAD